MKNNASSIGLGIALVCLAVSAAAFYLAFRQPQAANTAPQIPTNRCDPSKPSISRSAPEIRGIARVDRWRVFEQKKLFHFSRPEIIETARVPDGKALRMKIEGAGTFNFDTGVSMLNQRQILQGEMIYGEVWLRGAVPEGTRLPLPIQIELVLQENNPPNFRRLNKQIVTLTPKFERYRIIARSTGLYCPEELNFALHLATGKQIVDIGPAEIKVGFGKIFVP
jgi:hypothetical protein